METVKEFKDAGLVFVEGDVVDGINGRSDSHSVDFVKMSNIMLDVGVSDSWTMREFAWRTNTGDKPSFSGLVEVKVRYMLNGELRTQNCIYHSDVLENDKHAKPEWRPVISKGSGTEDELAAVELAKRVELSSDVESLIDLDDDLEVRDALEKLQQEAKPTYTKEMHEAGELPPVGSKFMLAKKVNCQRIDQFQGVECEVIGQCKSKAGCDVIVFSNPLYGFTCMNHLPELIKPIQTDEEKLIDDLAEWLELADKTNSATYETKARATIAWLEAMGYRKL